jgi:hypothetical protein
MLGFAGSDRTGRNVLLLEGRTYITQGRKILVEKAL